MYYLEMIENFKKHPEKFKIGNVEIEIVKYNEKIPD